MWFGTIERAQWIPVPQSGAESSPESWRSSGTLLSGGGFGRHSRGNHKTFRYSWSNASSREAAQRLKDYRDGVFGDGLLYWHSPLNYTTNVLPARWGSPGITLDKGDPGLNHSATRHRVTLPNPGKNRLPVVAAEYRFDGKTVGYREPGSLFIPIPEGYTLRLGWFGSKTGNTGVFFSRVTTLGNTSNTFTPVDRVESNDQNIVPTIIPGAGPGVRLWIGTTGGAGSLVLHGMVGRLFPSERPVATSSRADMYQELQGPWIGGQGHSGCIFDSDPTYVEYTGVNGGQVGYAADFREVGAWVRR